MRIMTAHFFGLTLLLKSLSRPEAMQQLERIHTSYDDGAKRDGILLGYKLIIETILYKQMDAIITCSDALLLDADHELARWWSSTERKSTKTFNIGANGNPANSALVANFLNDLLLQVVRCGNRLENLVEVSKSTYCFTQVVDRIAKGCGLSLSEAADSESKVDIDHALRLCAGEVLYDFFYERGDSSVDDAYGYTYPSRLTWKDGSPLERFGFSEVATSRDVVGFKPPQLRNPQKDLQLGFNAALVIALSNFTNDDRILSSKVDGDMWGSRTLFGEMLDEFRPGSWPCITYHFGIGSPPSDTELEGIMLQETSPVDSGQYLTDLFGDKAFLASGMSSNTDLHFQVLIYGLLMVTPEDSLVDVVQIDHLGSPEQPHPPVSLAVRVGMFWHVFYYIDAVGRMKSPVWTLLDEYGDRIEVRKVERIETGLLLSLCDRAFQYVSRQWKAQKDLNSDLRGAIPELLAAALLTCSGYFPVKPSLEEIKGVGQIDAIGFKESVDGSECRLVEVKKQSTNQNQLQEEIIEFEQKIERARVRIVEIGREVGFAGPTKTVSGLFISMAEIGDLSEVTSDSPEAFPGFFDTPDVRVEFKTFLDGLPDIEFWDYNDFKRELENAALPAIPIRLLEEANLVWEVQNPGMDREEVLQGLLMEAVEKDIWQRPDNSEPVKARVDDVLRNH